MIDLRKIFFTKTTIILIVLSLVCLWLLGFIFRIEILSFIADSAIIGIALLLIPVDMLHRTLNDIKKSKGNDFKPNSDIIEESAKKSNKFFNFSITFLFLSLISSSLILLFILFSMHDQEMVSIIGFVIVPLALFSFLTYFLCYIFLILSSKKNEIKTIKKPKLFLKALVMLLIISLTTPIILYTGFQKQPMPSRRSNGALK